MIIGGAAVFMMTMATVTIVNLLAPSLRARKPQPNRGALFFSSRKSVAN